jgi:glycerophosphoryl diester phosphodiesterase
MALTKRRSTCRFLLLVTFTLYGIHNVTSQVLTEITTENSPQCLPNTLKISDKVSHRPQRLTIAHRGASAHLPEHTTQAYRLALEMGADYIEPDLVSTADGELIALHTVDLNKTTNVAEVFDSDRMWYSSTENRIGYWTYNFTYKEIQNLTVVQRLPTARTTAFDGLFGIPRLSDILQVLKQWNTVDLPARLPPPDPNESSGSDNSGGSRRPTTLELHQAGVYIELKDAGWLLDDAGIDLTDLFFQHLQEHSEEWDHLLTCYQEIRFDAYKVPGLVIQSFDGPILQKLSERWKTTFQDTLPVPPLVLLVDHRTCWEENFWFQVGDKWRDYISGVGCEKQCLLNVEEGTAFQERAEEFDLVLHPWTERPEHEYVYEGGFDSALEETRFLFCKSGAQGIFSESVDTAILAAHLGCDDYGKQPSGGATVSPSSVAPAPTKSPSAATPTDGSTSPTATDNDGQQQQPETAGTTCPTSDESSSSFFVAVASFATGAAVTTVVALYLRSRRTKRFGDGRVVPTGDMMYDLEMT